MAQDFNLSDDMVIRFEQALQALSNASDAIDNASLVLRDAFRSTKRPYTGGVSVCRT
jgi:hypothetical protein